MASALEVKHFLFWSNLFHSLACLQHTMQKVLFDCVFYVPFITYLITFNLEKEIIVLEKSLEKVLNFGSKNLYEP